MVSANPFGFPSYSIVGTPENGQEASITFNSNEADAFGSYWFLDGDVQGWDSPDMRVSMLTKIGSGVQAEGELPSDLHYRGRSLVMKLMCEATSEIARENSRLLLAQACNTSACVFTAFEEVPKFCNVVRSGNTNQGKLTMEEKGYTNKAAASFVPPDGSDWGLPVGTTVYLFEVTIELYAMDPFKYGTSLIIADFEPGSGDGIATYDNPGTYPSANAFVNFTATGGGDGPIGLFCGDRFLQLLVPTVPVGAPTLDPIPENLYIDLYNRLIYDGTAGPPPDSNFFYLRDMQTQWLEIATGESAAMTTTPYLAGTVNFHPAWL